jgi:hypothetical protein
MSSTTGESLLRIWSLRLKMADDGTIHPSEGARRSAMALVKKLREIDDRELIEIDVIEGRELLARFIRTFNGEIIAEFPVDEEPLPDAA